VRKRRRENEIFWVGDIVYSSGIGSKRRQRGVSMQRQTAFPVAVCRESIYAAFFELC
jgi:hypothetical protein